MFAAEMTYRSWVAVHGYRWVRYRDLPDPKGRGIGGLPPDYYHDYPGRVLTEVHSTTDPSVPRQYRACEPFKDHPALYREFAAIPWGDVDAIKGFAARYGMLDSNQMMGTSAYPLPKGVKIHGRETFVPADPEEDWTEGPAMFRALIRAWESPPEKLGDTFCWEEVGGGYSWVWHPDPADGPPKRGAGPGLQVRVVYREWDTPDFSATLGEPTPVHPVNLSRRWDGPGVDPPGEVADAFIRQEISKGLAHVSYRVQFVPGAGDEDLFQVTPSNLLAALFIQFGRAVAGDKEHHPCKACGRWFEMVPQDKGRREFCSDACKVRDYRGRKKQAVELRAEGLSPKQIAEATGTDLETVRRWVGSASKPNRKRT